MSARAFALGVALCAGASACSAPSPGTFAAAALPDEATFGPVAQLLDVRCGSLDCHGAVGRNLRLYGSAGLRLAPTDRPLAPPCDTPAEVVQDYASVVDLEPEVMSAVVASGGADPERLTMVRKARGAEAHKGGAIWAAGDPSDTCLVSWLAGHADAGACQQGMLDALPDSGPSVLLTCIMTDAGAPR